MNLQDPEEKKELIIQRQSLSFWQDAWRRLRKNPTAMIGLALIILSLLFAFVGPLIVPYKYDEQIRGFENLSPMQTPQERSAATKLKCPNPKTEARSLHMILIHQQAEETTAPETVAVEIKEAIFPSCAGNGQPWEG